MRSIALVLAVLITAIACLDPLCCSDGCTRGDVAATNHTAQRGGDCPICQPGAVAAVPTLPAATLVLASTTLSFDQSPLDSVPPAIEHPPRS